MFFNNIKILTYFFIISLQILPAFEIKKDLQCVAQYSKDGFWYRAVVISVDQSEATVFFVDYGNLEKISFDRIKKIEHTFLKLPAQAVHCCLYSVTKLFLSKDEENYLSDLLYNNQHEVEFFRDFDRVYEVIIKIQNPDDASDKSNILDLCVDNSTTLSYFDQRKKDNKSFVCKIESVDKFWIQENKFICDLELMQEKLVKANFLLPNLATIEEGMMCVAKFSLNNNMYYRARILSHNHNEATVFFIDYGLTSKSNDLRMITKDLAQVKPFARKCCLVKPEGVKKWPDNIDEEFKELSKNGSTVFLLDIIEEGEICLVKLSIDEYDIAQVLIEVCIKYNKNTVEAPSKGEIGQENVATLHSSCKICLYESPGEFWIHHDSLTSELNIVTEKLKEAQYFEKIFKIKKKKKLIAVKYNSLWYRAEVNVHTSSVTILTLIDIGNLLVVNSPFNFRKLPENLIKIPRLATRCYLKPPEYLESWPKKAWDKLTKLYERETKFEVQVHHTIHSLNYSIVSLFFKGQNVEEII